MIVFAADRISDRSDLTRSLISRHILCHSLSFYLFLSISVFLSPSFYHSHSLSLLNTISDSRLVGPDLAIFLPLAKIYNSLAIICGIMF